MKRWNKEKKKKDEVEGRHKVVYETKNVEWKVRRKEKKKKEEKIRKEEQQWFYLSHSWRVKEDLTFPKVISRNWT